MFRLLFLLSIGCSCFAQEAWGQAIADTVVVLPAAEVEAGPTATPGSHLTLLTPRQIETEQGSTLADLLEHQSGMQIRRYGPTGVATAAARGLGAGHTVVLLDGLSITDPQSGAVDFQTIPIVLLESVEIVHGTGDPNQTIGGLGATIRLRTPEASDGPSARAVGSLGAFGAHRAGVRFAQGSGQSSFMLASEWAGETGDFVFEPFHGTDGERRRTGADTRSFTGFAKALLRKGNKRLSIAGLFTDLERGLPGPANAPPVEARQWDRSARIWTKAKYRIGVWETWIDGAFHNANVRYENNHTGVATDETAKSLVGRTGASYLAGRLLVQLGLESRYDDTRLAGQTTTEAYASGLFEKGRLMLTGGLRVARWSTNASGENAWIPRFGLSWRAATDEMVVLRAGIGRAFRAPTVTERFWEPGGNPDLVAERGWNAELGLSSKLGQESRQRIEVTAFYTDLENRIVWSPAFVGAGVQIWRPYNVGNVVTKGIEAMIASTHGKSGGISVDLGLTGGYIEAVDRSDENAASFGNQLRYIPRLTLGLQAGITAGRVTAHFTNRMVGERFITSDESMSEPSYHVVDAQLRASWKRGNGSISITVMAENLFDAEYAVIRFYPMPPRHFKARLQYDLQ